HTFPARLRKIYEAFRTATRDELVPKIDDLRALVRHQPGVLESYVTGEKGNNVLFNTQADAYLNAMDVLHDVAFDEFSAFVRARSGHAAECAHYLEELKRYSLMKKKVLRDFDDEDFATFDYDFVELERAGFEQAPSTPTPTTVRFFLLPWQIAFFRD